MKLFVGNLSFQTTEDELRQAFEQYGEVVSAKIINDRETGRSRGFGFVEMDDEGGRAAIDQVNGKQIGGRDIRVNEAHDKPRASRGARW